MHFFDGSASYRATSDANSSWMPRSPKAIMPTRINYDPRSWEAPRTDPNKSERLDGVYRWTRGGLKGIDFDAEEIDTGQKR